MKKLITTPAAIEEFIADTDDLCKDFASWAEKWSVIGRELDSLLTDSQREDVMKAFSKLEKVVMEAEWE